MNKDAREGHAKTSTTGHEIHRALIKGRENNTSKNTNAITSCLRESGCNNLLVWCLDCLIERVPTKSWWQLHTPKVRPYSRLSNWQQNKLHMSQDTNPWDNNTSTWMPWVSDESWRAAYTAARYRVPHKDSPQDNCARPGLREEETHITKAHLQQFTFIRMYTPIHSSNAWIDDWQPRYAGLMLTCWVFIMKSEHDTDARQS
jgi:hypothetical protein